MFALRIIVLTLLTANIAVAQSRTYEDQDHGFSVRTISKWDQVPPEPTEKNTVARWASPREIRGLPARMFVHVFDKQGRTTGKRERPVFSRVMTFERWMKWNRRGVSLPKGKKVKVEAPEGITAKGMLHEFERDSGYSRGGRPMGNFYTVFLVTETAQKTYVLEMFVHAKEKRKYRGLFRVIVKSFELIEVERAVSANGKAPDDMTPKDRARERAKAEAAKVPGWWFEESENYVIVTNLPKRRRIKILQLRKELEAIRAHMERKLPPARPIEAISIVRVCADRETYLQYGAPPSSAGYWYAVAEELVLYAEGAEDRTREVLYHEGFHQYIYYAMGGVSPCICLNEGGADYYSGADIRSNRVQKIERVQSRQETIREAIRSDKHVPIKKILKFSQPQFYSNQRLCYSEGWSIVYFLRHGLVKGHPWEKILPKYYETLREEVLKIDEDEARWAVTKIRKKAYDAAFKDVDLDEFEAKWKDYTVSGKIARP